jgi:hypothetical protein
MCQVIGNLISFVRFRRFEKTRVRYSSNVYRPSQMIAEISTCRMSFLGRWGAGPSFPTGRTQSSDTLRYSFEVANLAVRFGSTCGSGAEAERLPKMAPRNTGGHQRERTTTYLAQSKACGGRR